MYKKNYLLLVILSIITILTSCNNPNQNETNNTADNGTAATSCDVNGELAMVSAPVIIAQKDSIECGKKLLSLKTSVILKDDYHSLATICKNKLFVELYYSVDSGALASLQQLASTAAGGNFQLPRRVGRIIEARAIPAERRSLQADSYIISGNPYSPNRLEYKVLLPAFVGDFNEQNVNPNSNVLRNGDKIFYKWAKRIAKDDGADPMTISSETFSVVYQAPNSLSAGPDKTITLPGKTNVVLEGNIVNRFRSMDISSFLWKAISVSFVPQTARIINPHNPVTEIEFIDYGDYLFQLSAKDNCNKIYTDTVEVKVLGQLNSASRNCLIQSGQSCAEGSGREVSIKNLSVDRYKVKLKLITDLRSWQDSRTARAGTKFEETIEIILNGNETKVLGCSVSKGSGTNASDIGYNTWSFISEEKL